MITLSRHFNYTNWTLIIHIQSVRLLCSEESPNDFDKNHQVKVDTHLVI